MPTLQVPIPTRALLAVLAVAGAALGCGADGSPPAPGATSLAVGTWGGENAGVVVGDTVAHVHVGCTFGDFPVPARLDAAGRFTVPGRYVLRAFPIVLGPTLPARFMGSVAGDVLTLRVAVDDTTAGRTVELGPVMVTLGRDPRMGPCPICRTPRPLPTRRRD